MWDTLVGKVKSKNELYGIVIVVTNYCLNNNRGNWIIVIIHFPWPLFNSLTFPGFPEERPPWILSTERRTISYRYSCCSFRWWWQQQWWWWWWCITTKTCWWNSWRRNAFTRNAFADIVLIDSSVELPCLQCTQAGRPASLVRVFHQLGHNEGGTTGVY